MATQAGAGVFDEAVGLVFRGDGVHNHFGIGDAFVEGAIRTHASIVQAAVEFQKFQGLAQRKNGSFILANLDAQDGTVIELLREEICLQALISIDAGVVLDGFSIRLGRVVSSLVSSNSCLSLPDNGCT